MYSQKDNSSLKVRESAHSVTQRQEIINFGDHELIKVGFEFVGTHPHMPTQKVYLCRGRHCTKSDPVLVKLE